MALDGLAGDYSSCELCYITIDINGGDGREVITTNHLTEHNRLGGTDWVIVNSVG